MNQRVAVIVLTCDRVDLFRDTVASLRRTAMPPNCALDITVMDNSETEAAQHSVDDAMFDGRVDCVIRSAVGNIGIADGLNLAYGAAIQPLRFSCRPEPDYVAIVQDDVVFTDPTWLFLCLMAYQSWPDLGIVSGYNSTRHPTLEKRVDKCRNAQLFVQESLPGVHLFAPFAIWQRIFPLPVPAHHLNEDFWITRDSPGAPRHVGKVCGVIPGLVRHVGLESRWNSTPQVEYNDPIAELV